MFFSAVTSTLLLHKLNSWMWLVLCCATWMIASRFCNFFVKSVGRLNYWRDKSWQLWVAIIYVGLFLQSCEQTWTELCLWVNCASPHIRVDEVLVSCYRLLGIHASEVLWTPWQCSLPGRSIHQNSTWQDLNGQLLQNDNFPKIQRARGRPALCMDFLPAGISTKPKRRTVIWKRTKSIDSVLPALPSYIWQTAKGANPDNRQPGHYKRKLNC